MCALAELVLGTVKRFRLRPNTAPGNAEIGTVYYSSGSSVFRNRNSAIQYYAACSSFYFGSDIFLSSYARFILIHNLLLVFTVALKDLVMLKKKYFRLHTLFHLSTTPRSAWSGVSGFLMVFSCNVGVVVGTSLLISRLKFSLRSNSLSRLT